MWKDTKVKERLEDAFNYLSQDKGYEVVCVNLYGSQNYELDTKDSDIDIKAVVIPSIDEVIMNKKPVSEIVEFVDGFIDIKDIRLMCECYKKQNINFIETLFTDYYFVNILYPEWKDIRAIANEIAYADKEKAIKCMYGMALEKQHALCHPYPSKANLIEEYGYDSKQLVHIFRIKEILKKYLLNMKYKDCLKLDMATKRRFLNIKGYKEDINVETAKLLANSAVNDIKNLVDEALKHNKWEINQKVYDEMDNIKAKLIKRAFKKE